MAVSERQELDELRRLDELEAKAARVIDTSKLTDPHEIEFVEGRRGTLSEDDMQEALRQYRSIRKSDKGIPNRGYTRISTTDAPPQLEQAPPPEPVVTPTIPAAPPTYLERHQGYLPKTLIPPQTRGPESTEAIEPLYQVLTAPFAAGRDALLGGTPRELADKVFGPPSLDWKQNVIPGTMEGLLDLIPSLPFLFGTGGRGRTPSHPTKLEPTIIESPETTPPIIPAATALHETIPSGGAYSSTELLTPPGSRIDPQHQFSTGSGESLFGPLERIDAPTPGPMAPISARPETPGYTVEPYFLRKDEKYPTIEEAPVTEQPRKVKPPTTPKIDTGSTGPSGEYIPPKAYTEPPTPGKWRKAWNAEKQRWGQELPVLKTQPDSPVISAVEGTHVFVEDFMESLTKQPWLKTLMKMGDNSKMAPLESKWVKDWKEGRDFTQGMPSDVKQMLQRREELFDVENAIRRRRGVPEIPKTPGPYLPRLTDEDFKLMRSITRSQEGAKAAQNVGPFSQERIHELMQEGMAKGVTYKDWRQAMLMREARGAVLQGTDQMMTDLENGNVIFRTKEAAEAVSLTHIAYPADGLPFPPKGGTWWVRSAEERQFLLQNMRQMGTGTLSDMRGWAQQFLRNPSLVNPWPHIVKNMGLKQMQQAIAGGLNPAQVLKQTFVYRWGKPDMLEEFKQVMPFTETGRTVWELIEKTGPKNVIQQMSRVPGLLNAYARRKIFAKWDPAMRYGLWREYIKKGMTPQEAANHTWIDLIRYGTRAERIDAWNSVPFNFFVPWRVGTLRTMNKALQTAPVRFGLFMGAVDIIREMDYRYNGRWTHLPYDYIERPIMTLIMENKSEALTTLAATIVAGPGGEYMFRTVGNILNEIQGKGGVGDIRTIAWGMAQVYDLWPQYQAWEKDHDPRHITDMLGLIALGRHATPYGAPHRFGELIHEGLIRTHPQVRDTELLREAVKQHSDVKRFQKQERDIQKYQQPWPSP